jgi:hypothetical protein
MTSYSPVTLASRLRVSKGRLVLQRVLAHLVFRVCMRRELDLFDSTPNTIHNFAIRCRASPNTIDIFIVPTMRRMNE